MRTTVEIDDDLFRDMKRLADKEGASLKTVMNRLLRRSFTGRRVEAKGKTYRCPTFHMGGVKTPDGNLDKALSIAELLEDGEVVREVELRK
jgi:hypothetical protein